MDAVGRRDYGSLTSAQARALDAVAAHLGVGMHQLMETAGFQVARLAWRMLGHRPGRVHVVAGHGNNGGDGAVAARYLAAWSCTVSCAVLGQRDTMGALHAGQISAAAGAGVAVVVTPQPASMLAPVPPDLVIDALLGTGLTEAPRPDMAEAIELVSGRVLSVDVPSGLDADDGESPGAVVTATATCALCAVKRGLWTPAAANSIGELYVADIGMPRTAWAAVGLDVPAEVDGGRIHRVPDRMPQTQRSGQP